MPPPWINRLADQVFLLRQRWSGRRPREWAFKLPAALRLPTRAELLSPAGRRSMLMLGVFFALIAATVFVYLFTRPAPMITTDTPRPVWFYDLADGKLFVKSSTLVPPIAAPSGKVMPDGSPMGVRAYIFSCGSCTDPQARYIGMLERYSPDVQMILQKPPPDREGEPPTDLTAVAARGHFIAKPDKAGSVAWHDWASSEGRTILEESNHECSNGQLPSQCLP
ncbi:MAG: hypothetical protein NTW19_08620 [Planctomycetota bacterium]|nr:hypothetical protein [Planctomycetota bacterium]